jgi:hypothetical protein
MTFFYRVKAVDGLSAGAGAFHPATSPEMRAFAANVKALILVKSGAPL